MTQPRRLTTEERDGLIARRLGFKGAPIAAFLGAMGRMTRKERLTVYQVLHDHYCPHCGIDQPPGDCQCAAPLVR